MKELFDAKTFLRRRNVLVLGIAGVLLYLALVVYAEVGRGHIGDWNYHLRGSISEAAFNGDVHKYDYPRFSYPPWIIPILAPLATIPNPWGTALNLWLGAVIIGAVTIKLGKQPWKAGLVFASPAFVMMLYYGGVDWLPLSGLLLPPAWGLLAMSVKPQVGITAALTWFQRAPTWRERFKIVLPTAVVALLSLVLWPDWPTWLFAARELRHYAFNNSVWPWGLIPAAVFAVYAWRKKSQAAALAIIPLASPYMSANAWVGFYVALAAEWPWVCLLLDIAAWGYAIFKLGVL